MAPGGQKNFLYWCPCKAISRIFALMDIFGKDEKKKLLKSIDNFLICIFYDLQPRKIFSGIRGSNQDSTPYIQPYALNTFKLYKLMKAKQITSINLNYKLIKLVLQNGKKNIVTRYQLCSNYLFLFFIWYWHNYRWTIPLNIY